MFPQETTVHCSNCDSGQIKVVIREHTKYRCNHCKLVVSNETRICKNHGNVGSYPTLHPRKEISKRCRICGGSGKVNKVPNSSNETTQETRSNDIKDNTLKAVDSLQQTISFDRKLQKAVKDFNETRLNHPQKLIKTIVNHIERFQPKEAIAALRAAIMPDELLAEVSEKTDCDKWVEKTHISNLIMWTLSLFLQNKNEDLAFQQVADASASLLGREFSTHGKSVDHEVIGLNYFRQNI